MILEGCPLAGRTGHQAAWELLEDLYARHVGGPLPPITRGSHGKPDFETGPWHFSLTHTPAHAFVALAREPVGVDAEELDRRVNLNIARRILSEGEYARFQSAPDPRRALLALWVLKEASAKCTGEGITNFPNQTDFSPDDPRVQTLEGCLVAIVLAATSDGSNISGGTHEAL